MRNQTGPKVKSAMNKPKNALQRGQRGLARVVHMQADLQNSVGNIQPDEGQVLHGASQTAEVGGMASAQEHHQRQSWGCYQPEWSTQLAFRRTSAI